MWGGVGKSGSPAPKPMTSWPAATRDLALASTARVADSSMAAIRLDRRAKVLAVVSGTPAMLTCPGRERKELPRRHVLDHTAEAPGTILTERCLGLQRPQLVTQLGHLGDAAVEVG